jgi:phage-related protein
VQERLSAWPIGIYASFLRISEQMVESGPHLGMPYTKAMGKGLFEIRAKGTEGIGRAFFCCMKDHKIVILHSFIKKTQATPVKELQIALKRMKEVYRG